ncbi:hypothetical protein J1605_002863 [Eschrichtius robustus]|uniref:Uncharacterized protein n=1 Tax=Eschrichtius robustus TaxID=9764 RepID=A0AB34HV21_ESCRO|nr:hypothetical protein J1605_002863 [Eschrichtius robustus]
MQLRFQPDTWCRTVWEQAHLESPREKASLLKSSPRLLCTATRQKNNGQNLEEDVGQKEQKTDLPSAEKTLMEEKVKLEE